jgi:hypothetical protein
MMGALREKVGRMARELALEYYPLHWVKVGDGVE